ncbi:uncharacterized protein J3D65DRAFT_226183 [Phyllosticta citribraziliensis]|uniref:Uncharacterized protein n=1 Tax=Phyllosticta citribraziliensis TaxID=989973 RepID=A0ABR1M539_9PEZI
MLFHAVPLVALTLLLQGQLQPVKADGGAQSALKTNGSSVVCAWSVDEFIGEDEGGRFYRLPTGYAPAEQAMESCLEMTRAAGRRVYGGQEWYEARTRKEEELMGEFQEKMKELEAALREEEELMQVFEERLKTFTEAVLGVNEELLVQLLRTEECLGKSDQTGKEL